MEQCDDDAGSPANCAAMSGYPKDITSADWGTPIGTVYKFSTIASTSVDTAKFYRAKAVAVSAGGTSSVFHTGTSSKIAIWPPPATVSIYEAVNADSTTVPVTVTYSVAPTTL